MTPSNPLTPGNPEMGVAPPGDYGELHLTLDEIVQEAEAFIKETLGDLIPSEIEPLAVEVCGSRTTGDSRWGSDLDLKLFYRGTLREDDAFNILNEEPLFIYGLFDGHPVKLKVDINPIKT